MKRKIKTNVVFYIHMLCISLALYFVHYLIFKNGDATVSGILLSCAYVPIGILFNSLIINRIMDKNEADRQLKKSNTINGSFFHEVGNQLLEMIIVADSNVYKIIEVLEVEIANETSDLSTLEKVIKEYDCKLDSEKIDAVALARFLEERDMLMLNLIMNSNTVIQDKLDNLIIEILHLRDELNPTRRCTSKSCKLKECEFVFDDSIGKIYGLLLILWQQYMKNLKMFYPELFIREMKNSPFACI